MRGVASTRALWTRRDDAVFQNRASRHHPVVSEGKSLEHAVDFGNLARKLEAARQMPVAAGGPDAA